MSWTGTTMETAGSGGPALVGGAHIPTLKGQFSLPGLGGPEQLGGCRQNPWMEKRLLLTPPHCVPSQVALLDAVVCPEEEGG